MELKSVSELTPRKAKRAEELIKKTVLRLAALDEYANPTDPTDVYLDNRSGRYVKMLEDLVDLAAEHGLLELVQSTLFGLLRMTKAGRSRADVNVSGVTKLREEFDFSNLDDESLKKALGRE
jgi:hypothetical protein